MGILAPIFFAALAGLAIPLVYHLVRRTPRGEQPFSSLMFLRPTPPRLTRRNRLDQVLLLLLRLGALALLAFAFTRPFLRQSALLSIDDLPRRRVAILLDNSASMRRGEVWQQALQRVERELADLAPQDDVALYTFSDRLSAVVGFAKERATSVPQTEVVRQSLAGLSPSWAAGDLGAALAGLAAELDAQSDVEQTPAEPRLVVISDFQKGSRLQSLQAFEWPQRVSVVLRGVAAAKTSNASVQLLPSDEAAPDEAPRVKVSNAADSTADQFSVFWRTGETAVSDDSEPVGAAAIYVPPGESRVVRLPRSDKQLLADRIVLTGDDHDFDNAFYVVPPVQQQIALVYLGADEADDPQGLQYYLRLAPLGDALRHVEVRTPAANSRPWRDPPAPHIVVLTQKVDADVESELTQYVEHGGTLLLAPIEAAAAILPAFLPGVQLAEDSPVRKPDDFLLLGEIDFTHPLFAPFANPRYNDFTKIHFWRRRPLRVNDANQTHVAARFDSGEPWLLTRTLGKGQILAVTSTWQADDSQLAVSSKFVPLVGAIVDLACGSPRGLASVTVNATVHLPDRRDAAVELQTPAGQKVTIAKDQSEFHGASEPGIYRSGAAPDALRFAVNLAASESDTAPLATEQLEQLGVRLGSQATTTERVERIRQQRDTELESRQRVWQWLLAGCLAVLVLETWWAGRATRAAHRATEAAT